MSLLSYFFSRLIFTTSSRYNKRIEVREINGKNELLVNGIEQTGRYTEKLWNAGLGDICARDVLVFGVGGGTVFRMFPDAKITGVDIDGEIIDIAKKYFGLQHANLIEKDVRRFQTTKKYDLIIIDLYIGNDVPEFAVKREFLFKVYSFLRIGGKMIINYYSKFDQEKKAATIASYFKHVQVKPVLRNMFIYVVK